LVYVLLGRGIENLLDLRDRNSKSRFILFLFYDFKKEHAKAPENSYLVQRLCFLKRTVH
jgi:hypothetical protein